MSEGQEHRQTLADRLNKLFDDIRPEGRSGRPYRNDEVAAEIKAVNPEIRITGGYLSALRRGRKTNPSTEVLTAIARFFGVPGAYFLNEATAAQADAEIELAKVMGNLGVRQLALRALDLTPDGLDAVAQVVEQLLVTQDRVGGGSSEKQRRGTEC
ncbi:secretion protein EspR [Longimycelium tulufanense]|uniref:Secretion protein EspR n=1 Tax=Longimycelium tulufanense TaxID=907463 RepID=A0A8J3CIT7_9PSEU|nr:helix-turn-helix domain-containing protein [Longimycelium tulufanense]GGM83567.1 secretion protein EspR [Longimycelium tulufanense]